MRSGSDSLKNTPPADAILRTGGLRAQSFADRCARVTGALAEIVAGSQGDVLLVGHAGVNRLILCSVLGIPVRNLHGIGQDYGCVNIIEHGSDRRAFS
jgi:broad specificity phosphatase PhoE